MRERSPLADGVLIDADEAIRFLQTAFHADDWLAVFLKRNGASCVAQRVAPMASITAAPFRDWLVRENTAGSSIYVSVNPLRARTAVRRRTAVRTISHLFLDADCDLDTVLCSIGERPDLPAPSYVLRTSKDRGHVLWRVNGFSIEDAAALEKRLSRELHTDQAATACSQLTRLPGFLNHKRVPACRVIASYCATTHVTYTPSDFPRTERVAHWAAPTSLERAVDAIDRARRYVAALPPAISGQHGDTHTFKVCCRLVRGFGLTDSEAFDVLTAWNERCVPPWSERELLDKLRRARVYGREPIGGFLGAQV